MTRATSSRSAKATPKTAPAPDTSGTPPTDPNSGSISAELVADPPTLRDRTIWHMEDSRGDIYQVTVAGANGRISWSRGTHREGGEVRIYRTATSKHYDAAFPDIARIWSQNVLVEKVGKTGAAKEAEEHRMKLEKERFERVIERVLSKGSIDPFDEDEVEILPAAPEPTEVSPW